MVPSAEVWLPGVHSTAQAGAEMLSRIRLIPATGMRVGGGFVQPEGDQQDEHHD